MNQPQPQAQHNGFAGMAQAQQPQQPQQAMNQPQAQQAPMPQTGIVIDPSRAKEGGGGKLDPGKYPAKLIAIEPFSSSGSASHKIHLIVLDQETGQTFERSKLLSFGPNATDKGYTFAISFIMPFVYSNCDGDQAKIDLIKNSGGVDIGQGIGGCVEVVVKDGEPNADGGVYDEVAFANQPCAKF